MREKPFYFQGNPYLSFRQTIFSKPVKVDNQLKVDRAAL